MVSKKEQYKEQKVKKSIFDFFRNEKFKMVLGLSFILIAFFLFFAMISFLFTWKTDNIEWLSIFSNASVSVDNWAGKLGAYLSFVFVYKWFGLASFAFPFLFIVLGAALLDKAFLPLAKTLKIVISAIIIASLLLGFVDNVVANANFLLGGEHGYFVIQWFVSFMGNVGTAIFLLFVVFSFLIVLSAPFFLWVKSALKKKEKLEDTKETFTEESEDLLEDTPLDSVFDEDAETEEESLQEEIQEEFNLEESVENEEPLNPVDEIIAQNIEEEKSEDIEEKSTLEDEAYKEVDMDVEEMSKEEEAENTETKIEPLGKYDPRADLSHFKFPDVELLKDHEVSNTKVTPEELNENKEKIVDTLKQYKIEISKIMATIGPSITLYEIVPAPGVRIAKIKNLGDDIALSLAALGIRIIAPIPGKGTVGIEVPNKNPQVVSMRATIASKAFQESKFELPIILGKTIYNKTHVIDLAKTPHMLVAGATGQGKSVGINAILTSLLFKKHPAELKFVLIDPKKVELSIYSRIEKYYLARLPEEEEPIITDVQKVVATLNSLTKEMDTRYDLLKKANTRNIIEYNNKFINRKLNPEKGHHFLPYIVVVIDEFADLIMTAGKEVEAPIARIAQLARAIGIHLIVATQRPSTNVITGMIKANFPTRVAFRVMQMVDSRTILDSPGANQLIGRGDMLINQGGGEMIRLQCPFVDTPEIEDLVVHISEQQSYTSAFLLPEPDIEATGADKSEINLQKRDAIFDDAARLVVASQQGSTSGIQRRFSIGYNRAGRIMDQLEAANIVGPYEGSKARKVLIPDESTLEQFLNSMNQTN